MDGSVVQKQQVLLPPVTVLRLQLLHQHLQEQLEGDLVTAAFDEGPVVLPSLQKSTDECDVGEGLP